jgi:hypothetical protein
VLVPLRYFKMAKSCIESCYVPVAIICQKMECYLCLVAGIGILMLFGIA